MILKRPGLNYTVEKSGAGTLRQASLKWDFKMICKKSDVRLLQQINQGFPCIFTSNLKTGAPTPPWEDRST